VRSDSLTRRQARNPPLENFCPVAVPLTRNSPPWGGAIDATIVDVLAAMPIGWEENRPVAFPAAGPEGPCGPGAPCGPVAPLAPCGPVAPCGPLAPCGPWAFQDSSVNPVLQPAVLVVWVSVLVVLE